MSHHLSEYLRMAECLKIDSFLVNEKLSIDGFVRQLEHLTEMSVPHGVKLILKQYLGSYIPLRGSDEWECTLNQKIKIVQHFIRSCPHGEIPPFINDIKHVARDVWTDGVLFKTMTKRNKQKFELVTVSINDTNTYLLCCPQAEIEPNEYIHPQYNRQYLIHPITHKVVFLRISNVTVPSLYQEYRSVLNDKLCQYLSDKYGKHKQRTIGTGYVYHNPDKDSAFDVVISYKNVPRMFYWSNGWQSEWTFSIEPNVGTITLEGRVRINVHHYEDGNVQLNLTFAETVAVNVADVYIQNVRSISDAIVLKIEETEDKWTSRLEQYYMDAQRMLKQLRLLRTRLVRSRMDWRKGVHIL
eukprot:129755_1